MEWELRKCRRWLVVVVLVSWLCCVSVDCLQPINNDRSLPWAITGDEETISSSATDSLRNPNDGDGNFLWELPISRSACDPSSPECRGASVTTDDSTELNSRKEPEERRAVVLCNIKCFRADPVCGEDAITYWCGAAEAQCAGVEVAYKGYCDARSGGAGKDGSRAAQSLFLVHLVWLVFAGILVIADLL